MAKHYCSRGKIETKRFEPEGGAVLEDPETERYDAGVLLFYHEEEGRTNPPSGEDHPRLVVKTVADRSWAVKGLSRWS